MISYKTLNFILCLVLGSLLLVGCTRNSPNQPTATNTKTASSAEEAIAVETPTSAPEMASAEAEPVNASIDSVQVLISTPIDTLEPYYMVNVHPDASVSSHLWDSLTRLNGQLEVEPSLAESWRVVNNFTWEFKLRQNLFFHNDELITTEAVRFSINRSKSLPGSLETFATNADIKEIEVVDEVTIRFVTNQPTVNLPYHLAFLEILPPVYYKETSVSQITVAPVGSGPYKLSQETSKERLVLEAVSDYWGGQPDIARLIFITVPTVEDRLAALSDKDTLTIATDLPPTPLSESAISNGRFEFVESTQRLFVGINLETSNPFQDQMVRHALNYAVDVEQLITDYHSGYGEQYGSWINPPHHNPDLTPWPYDPEQARLLLEEAGYSKGITTTLATPVNTYYNDVLIAEAIAEQLDQVGIHVIVEKMDWPVYVRRLLDVGNRPALFLLALNSHGDGVEDAKNLSAYFPFNPTGWENDKFELALNRATFAFEDNVRARRLNEVQTIAYNDAPWLWLWRPYKFYGVSDELNWSPRPDGLVYLYQPAQDNQ